MRNATHRPIAKLKNHRKIKKPKSKRGFAESAKPLLLTLTLLYKCIIQHKSAFICKRLQHNLGLSLSL